MEMALNHRWTSRVGKWWRNCAARKAKLCPLSTSFSFSLSLTPDRLCYIMWKNFWAPRVQLPVEFSVAFFLAIHTAWETQHKRFLSKEKGFLLRRLEKLCQNCSFMALDLWARGAACTCAQPSPFAFSLCTLFVCSFSGIFFVRFSLLLRITWKHASLTASATFTQLQQQQRQQERPWCLCCPTFYHK